MATFCVNDYIDIGTKGYHNATSWQVALDNEFNYIIDETHKNTVAVKKWVSMLPKINEPGYYKDLNQLYARVKVWIDDNESDWYVCEPKNQNDQTVIYTEKGQPNIVCNSIDINLN